MEIEVCEWTRGATPGVYKSSCSLVPFLESVEPNEFQPCPYCGEPVKLFGAKVEYDSKGQVRPVHSARPSLENP